VKFLLIVAINLPAILFAQTSAQRPFPWRLHIRYAAGTILPQAPSEEMDKNVESFYLQWRHKYILRDKCNHKTDYVWQEDKDEKNTSQGQGYGMIIVALMAGYDPQAKDIYDSLYQFYRDHPSKTKNVATSKYLMSWQQNNDCNFLDDAAPDGDMDIAYSLILAYYQWSDSMYLKAADSILNGVTTYEVSPITHSLLLNDDDRDSKKDDKYFLVRSSDFMPAHFRIFRHHGTDSLIWDEVLAHGYTTVLALQNPVTGFVPNFAHDIPNQEPEPFDGKLKGEDHPPKY